MVFLCDAYNIKNTIITELNDLGKINCLRRSEVSVEGSSGPEVIKLFSCSTQLSMKFFLLINVKMPIIVGILTFVSRKNSSLSLSEPDKC